MVSSQGDQEVEFYERKDKAGSLAQTLRQRRELTEKLEQERKMLGLNKNRQMHVFKNLPTQTDDFGSGFRIRPQETPRINLLKLKKKNPVQELDPPGQDLDLKNHPLFSKQAQLPQKKPFNYLNPYQSLGKQPEQKKPDDLNAMSFDMVKLQNTEKQNSSSSKGSSSSMKQKMIEQRAKRGAQVISPSAISKFSPNEENQQKSNIDDDLNQRDDAIGSGFDAADDTTVSTSVNMNSKV